ncbi:hypothetical protein BD310DRAFT_931629 [Dichomitus squalens]|uniref:Uncharacterized protein n=1 Tax=Dichomitus squalens TaxID=114155 RepID=A0A4Q9PPX6_9APHY|nr:hypothetical protein BD310DRAFT_931629 [Dichomitus squalens]
MYHRLISHFWGRRWHLGTDRRTFCGPTLDREVVDRGHNSACHTSGEHSRHCQCYCIVDCIRSDGA